jgi:hypothetical protein
MVKLFIKLAVIFILVPQLVFGDSSFTPQIKNQGSYKQFDMADKPNLYGLLGHVPTDIHNSIQEKQVEGDRILELSIVLALNHEDELDKRLVEIIHPGSLHYQQFLSQYEYIARYSPTVEQVDKIISYLENNGIHVASVESNRLIIRATGPIDQNGERFYAPAYFSVNGVNSQASSYSGSAPVTYVVQNDQSPSLNLTIAPQSGNVSYSSVVEFTLTLTNGQIGVANNPITLSVHGPVSLNMTGNTGTNGIYQFYLYINKSLPEGTYQMTATSQYQGSTATGHATFVVK